MGLGLSLHSDERCLQHCALAFFLQLGNEDHSRCGRNFLFFSDPVLKNNMKLFVLIFNVLCVFYFPLIFG